MAGDPPDFRPPRRRSNRRSPGRARGAFLLEALLAVVVFAIGLLGLLGLIANAMRESGNARSRGEAFDIASSALSRMWTEDPAELEARYDRTTNGPGFRMLLDAASRLPGVTTTSNLPVVTIEDSLNDRRRVGITVYWQQPGEALPHRSTVTGVLPPHP